MTEMISLQIRLLCLSNPVETSSRVWLMTSVTNSEKQFSRIPACAHYLAHPRKNHFQWRLKHRVEPDKNFFFAQKVEHRLKALKRFGFFHFWADQSGDSVKLFDPHWSNIWRMDILCIQIEWLAWRNTKQKKSNLNLICLNVWAKLPNKLESSNFPIFVPEISTDPQSQWNASIPSWHLP